MINYNFLEKSFHNLIFKYNFINQSLFEIEKLFFNKTLDFEHNLHIFITGLPRSGTTSLLNLIHSSNKFACLKYLNMPFVLSPNLTKFFKTKKISLKERAHNDGIFFNQDSPEAFDELFFKIFDKKNKDTDSEFKLFIKLILISQKKNFYLSKNNSNYQRIDYIRKILHNSKFLILFRNPLEHANSLYLQHLNFIKLQEKDEFVKKYMDYLGHHEFGLNHKNWNKPEKYFNTFDINYWLEQWILFYREILIKFKNTTNCNFIPFEDLSDKSFVENLMNKIQTKNVNYNIIKKMKKKDINLNYDKKILDEGLSIYKKLYSLKELNI